MNKGQIQLGFEKYCESCKHNKICSDDFDNHISIAENCFNVFQVGATYGIQLGYQKAIEEIRAKFKAQYKRSDNSMDSFACDFLDRVISALSKEVINKEVGK